jgi:hypothetical protein
MCITARHLRWNLLMALAACMTGSPNLYAQSGNEIGARPASSGDCNEESVAVIIRDGIALARVYVNQKPADFIVDTAGQTMINSDRLALPVVRRIRTGPVGVSGEARLEWWNVVKVESLAVGGVELRDSKILSQSLRALEKQLGLEVDGILGQDTLRVWDSASLNYKRRVLILRRPCARVL